jgi:crotonobetainyl-CoA:carnitine CoA-transferase CaiB-like acyl-CoA transferase
MTFSLMALPLTCSKRDGIEKKVCVSHEGVMDLPLSGIKVLDLSMFLSGPRASQLLADFGAEVVKLEPPGGETMRVWMKLLPDQEEAMTHWHRNKKAISLDLRQEEGVKIFKGLVPHFDVLIENLAPGTMEKRGLGYDDLKELNPALIYCSISGFGKNAPFSHRVAFDIIAQATGGIMAAQRTRDRSPGVFFGDMVSGAYAAFGILTALRHRDRTGQGQLVDISMQDVMYFHNFRAMQVRMQHDPEAAQRAMGTTFEDLFAGEDGLPFWRPYQAKDGYVAVVFLTERQWQDMCDLMGKPELKNDPRFNNLINRVKHRDLIKEELKQWMAARSVGEIEALLDEKRIPCGRVLETREVNEDINLKARGMIAEVRHEDGHAIPVPGIPIKLSASPGRLKPRGPEVGVNNADIYGRYLGLGPEDLKRLEDKGVV